MNADKGDVIFVYPRCGKYDMFILDMPLGPLYLARLLEEAGYGVHIVDQRVEDDVHAKLDALLEKNVLWVGISVMTGEPVRHALELAKYLRGKTDVPLLWGGIHPTILPEQTLENENVDYVLRGKGERSVLAFTEFLCGRGKLDDVPGLTYREDGGIKSNEEDCEGDWGEMPMVNYDLIDVSRYGRVGFDDNIFSIMTSRNCPFKCTFCYNSSLKTPKPWMPDSLDYVKKHIDYILERYHPDYLSFIDDDFFVDLGRAREILEYIEGKAPKMKIGFRGARVSDLLKLDDGFFDLMERVNTKHINIGVESGSDRILKIMKKGMTADMAVELNRRLAGRPALLPLYNFFSGIPQETEDDIRMSTRLVLQLVKENPHCQISGYHQYTPYPGNKLFEEAVAAGYKAPQSLEEWGSQRFEDNARNCPWINAKRRRLLDMIYSMIYFVDNKYDMYIAGQNWFLKMMLPFVRTYKPIARARLRRHFTAFPVEVWAKNVIYKILGNE